MEIGTLLKNRRIDLGLTLKEIADAVGVSEATVSRWESGEIANMKRDKIAALAKVLSISPAAIMGWEETPQEYYIDPEAAALAQQIYEDKELRALFDAARDADPEALQAAQAMLKVLKRKERGS